LVDATDVPEWATLAVGDIPSKEGHFCRSGAPVSHPMYSKFPAPQSGFAQARSHLSQLSLPLGFLGQQTVGSQFVSDPARHDSLK
jgi:hypothetical protein